MKARVLLNRLFAVAAKKGRIAFALLAANGYSQLLSQASRRVVGAFEAPCNAVQTRKKGQIGRSRRSKLEIILLGLSRIISSKFESGHRVPMQQLKGLAGASSRGRRRSSCERRICRNVSAGNRRDSAGRSASALFFRRLSAAPANKQLPIKPASGSMKYFMKLSLAPLLAMSVLALPSRLFAEEKSDGAKDGCFCMELYQPVCARLPSGEQKTFSNACFAKCAKAKIVHQGPC